MDYSKSLLTLSLLHGQMSIIAFFTFIVFFVIYKDRKKLTRGAVCVYILACLGLIIAYRAELKWWIVSIFRNLPLLTLFMLKKNDLRLFSNNIVKCFSVIISISFCLFILKQLGVHVPNLGKITFNQYDLVNYYYFYADAIRYGLKYTGISLEPGFFSVLCICLLVLNEFNFKKKSSWVFVVAILCTLSLEGYLLLVFGVIFFSYSKGTNIRTSLMYFLLAVFIIGVLIVYVINYQGGNNIITQTILERLVYDEELGVVGNNRENALGEQVLDMYFYSDKVWWGIGQEKLSKVSSIKGLDMCSWRVFVVAYGAIYTLMCFFAMSLAFLKTKLRKTFPVFALFIMDFYPHGDMFSETLVVLMIIFLLYLKEGRNENLLNEKKMRFEIV